MDKKKVLFVCVHNSARSQMAEACPVFPGTTATKRIHWSFDDPASFQGSREERLEKTRRVRDQIKHKIGMWSKSSIHNHP